jgi:hypothetical protein
MLPQIKCAKLNGLMLIGKCLLYYDQVYVRKQLIRNKYIIKMNVISSDRRWKKEKLYNWREAIIKLNLIASYSLAYFIFSQLQKWFLRIFK